MKLGIIANIDKIDQVLPLFHEFNDWIADKGVDLILHPDFYEMLLENDQPHLHSAESSELIRSSDVILTFGGDGTMLSTVRRIHDANKPLLGFHLGNLGFLAQLTLDNYREKIERLLKGEYSVEERMILEAQVEDPDQSYRMYALNDIVISKGNTPRMVRFRILVDGQVMNHYHSDGIIIASPTGSTAYSLSASGPILTPDLNAVVINPICPHSLTNRPIVINADRIIDMDFQTIENGGHITADGQNFFPLSIHSRVRIRKADFTVKLIRVQGNDFFQVLHNKLGWGA